MLDMEKVCGLPDALVLGLEVRRAAQAQWFLAGELPGVDREYLRHSIASAFSRWSAVCGCSGVETDNAARADLVIQTTRIDGVQGVLADCELPGPRVQKMRLDNSERWTIHVGPGVPGGQLDLVRVLTHELGHFWGLGHLARGNLMQPMYSDAIDRPAAGDVAEMVARYGPPVPSTPAPAPSPSPGVDLPAEMVILGQHGATLARYRLERIG